MTIKQDMHGLDVQAARPALSQTIAFGAASTPSVAFQSGPVTNSYAPDGTIMVTPNNTTHIRVVATANCWISFGAAPVAAAGGITSIYLPAGLPEYFWVNRGEKLAVIQDTGAGNLNVAELAN